MRKLVRSFGYAWQGLKRAAHHQRNLRIHLGCSFLVVAAGMWFGISVLEWCLLAIAMGMVISAELFNSALEELTDGVSPEKRTWAGHVKDMAAAAVMIIALAALAVGLLIFIPRMIP